MIQSAYIKLQREKHLRDQIIRVESLDNYTRIISTAGKPVILSKVIKHLEPILQPFGFIRVHRCHLINRNFIQSVQANTVTMYDAAVINISRRRKTEVFKLLAS